MIKIQTQQVNQKCNSFQSYFEVTKINYSLTYGLPLAARSLHAQARLTHLLTAKEYPGKYGRLNIMWRSFCKDNMGHPTLPGYFEGCGVFLCVSN